jgi:hypothetical protein
VFPCAVKIMFQIKLRYYINLRKNDNKQYRVKIISGNLKNGIRISWIVNKKAVPDEFITICLNNRYITGQDHGV